MVKHLPPGLPWDKVTITFDNRSGPPAIRYGDMVRAHGRPARAVVAPGHSRAPLAAWCGRK